MSNLVVRQFDKSVTKATGERERSLRSSLGSPDVGLLGDEVTSLREATLQTMMDFSKADESFRNDLAVYFEYLTEEIARAMTFQALESSLSSKRENLLIQSIAVTTYG